MVTGSIAAPHRSAAQTAQFRDAISVAGLSLAAAAGVLVTWAFLRMRRAGRPAVTGNGR